MDRPPLDHPLARRHLLQLGAAGAAGLVLTSCGLRGGQDGAAAPAPAPASFPPIEEEKGDLMIFDFAGTDEVELWKPYREEFPGLDPTWTAITGDSDTLSKIRAGARGDTAVAFGIVQSLLDDGAIIPWDTTQMENFATLTPAFAEAGVIDGEQYWVPSQWGFESAVYRTDAVADPTTYGILFDDAHAGRISWLDNPLVIPAIAGILNGVEDEFSMTDAELAQVEAFLVSKKKLVKTLTSTSADVTTAFSNNEVDVAAAWPDAWTTLVAAGATTAAYLKPKEGALAWVGGYVLLATTENYHHAHRWVDAVIDPSTQTWAAANWAVGPTQSTVSTSELDPTFVTAFGLDDPSALTSPHVRPEPQISRETYQRYGAMWDRVKAA